MRHTDDAKMKIMIRFSKIGWCTINARHSRSLLEGPVAACGSVVWCVAVIYGIRCSYI